MTKPMGSTTKDGRSRKLRSVLVASVAAVGLSGGADAASAACAPFVSYDSRTYTLPNFTLPANARTRLVLATMTVPACVDVFDPTNPPQPAPVELTITRVRGVNPRIAVGVAGPGAAFAIRVRPGVCALRSTRIRWTEKERLRCLQTYR